MINWEYLAVNFIRQAGRWNNQTDIDTYLGNCINFIKRLTAAHIVLYIEMAGGEPVIKFATKHYLQDVTVDVSMVTGLLAAGGPVFNDDILKDKNSFCDLFPALCSAAFIPISTTNHTGLVAMGWSSRQDFDHSFASFADVVQLRMSELVEMTELYTNLEKLRK